VETQAKRQYNQLVRQLINQGAEEELVEKAEILRLFLESADFNKLRAESEKHLLEGRKVKFLVHRERGRAKYEMKIV
jgi:RNA-splicing ligase RtcB